MADVEILKIEDLPEGDAVRRARQELEQKAAEMRTKSQEVQPTTGFSAGSPVLPPTYARPTEVKLTEPPPAPATPSQSFCTNCGKAVRPSQMLNQGEIAMQITIFKNGDVKLIRGGSQSVTVQ